MEFIRIRSNVSYKDDMKNADQHQSVSATISQKYDMRNTNCGEMRNTPQQLRVFPQQHFMPLGLVRTSYLLLPLNIESSYPALPTDNFTNTLSFLTFLSEVGKRLIYVSVMGRLTS